MSKDGFYIFKRLIQIFFYLISLNRMSEMDIPIHIAMALPISLKVPYTLDSQGNFFIFLECGSSACEITESKVPKLFDDLLCEHYQFTLSCEENESLKIHSAYYGRQHIPNNCASTRNG